MKTKALKTKSISTEYDLENINEQEESLRFPFFIKQSGLYTKSPFRLQLPTPLPVKTKIPLGRATDDQVSINLDQLSEDDKAELKIFPFLSYEEFRLDVDGYYPQMTASGYLKFPNVQYIAKLTKKSKYKYTGVIWYKYGNITSFPYTKISVTISGSLVPSSRKAKVVFTGPGKISRTVTYSYKSNYFRDVNLEYDCEQGVSPILAINTHAHPNKPATLPNENISLDTIYKRAGFNVSRSHDNIVPSGLKGANGKWSNAEMHDAMQSYWSKFQNSPQWALWTFFAQQHDMGSNLGGIMFDSIGPNHRQGTAIFNDSFINVAPAGEPFPLAFRNRMKFWTAAHEMGHAFNLAHSWQKSLGTPWIPLANEPEARSFMNYPYSVSGGLNSFYSSFAYRFSDNELLFLRHAPYQFVQMGNSSWFVNHGFTNEAHEEGHDLSFELRMNKPNNTVQFMEPVYVEFKLKNTSNSNKEIDSDIFAGQHEVVIEIEKPNGEIKMLKSFVQYLFKPDTISLKPTESIYHSQFISAGSDEWYIKESGSYKITAKVLIDGKLYTSNQMPLSVLNPNNELEVNLGNQYFTNDVARILNFNGSRVLDSGNEILEQVLSRMPETNAALHAAVALASPLASDFKVLNFKNEDKLQFSNSAAEIDGAFKIEKANKEKALQYLTNATKDMDKFMNTFGHIESENVIVNMTKDADSASTKKMSGGIITDMLQKFEDRGVSEKVIKELTKKLK